MNVSQAFQSGSMKSMVGNHGLTNELSRITNDHVSIVQPMKLLPGPSGNDADRRLTLKHTRVESVLSIMNKLVKGKLSLGAKILKVGGVDEVFRRIFSVREEEQLLRASRCCLSTVAGPIPGRLFVSTDKVAFCSDSAIIKAASPSGESLRFHYKIVIPVTKLKGVIKSENTKNPRQKYVQVVTTDEFAFWFMGLLHYKRTFKCLQQAVSQSLFC